MFKVHVMQEKKEAAHIKVFTLLCLRMQNDAFE